jgi:hypothetical protein
MDSARRRYNFALSSGVLPKLLKVHLEEHGRRLLLRALLRFGGATRFLHGLDNRPTATSCSMGWKSPPAMASFNLGCGGSVAGVAFECFVDEPGCGVVPDARADAKEKPDANRQPDVRGVADIGSQHAPGDVTNELVPIDAMAGAAVDAFGGAIPD